MTNQESALKQQSEESLPAVTPTGRSRPYLLALLLVGGLSELLYVLLVALSPLPSSGLHITPLATVWPWTLGLSHLLFPATWTSPASSPAFQIFLWLPGLVLLGLAGLHLFATSTAFNAARVHPNAHSSARYLCWLLGGAALFGLTLLFQPALFSGDLLSYLSLAHFPLTDRALALYGPLWPSVTAVLTLSGGTPLSFLLLKAAILLFHLVNCLLIWAILGKIAPARRLPGTLLYAWNPLVLVELAGNGHNVGATVCLLLLVLWLHVRARGKWSTLAALLLLGLAADIHLIVLLLVPLYIVFITRAEHNLARAAWQFCWRLCLALALVALVYLPFWHGASTFLALTSLIDVQSFAHSVLGLLAVPLRWLFAQITQGAHFPPGYMEPSTAADATLRGSAAFLFILLYGRWLGKVRRAPTTTGGAPAPPTSGQVMQAPGFDLLITGGCIVLIGYLTLVSGQFWPEYTLWLLWIAALRRFDALTQSVLLLSCTALLSYPLLNIASPFSAYQAAFVFGIPFAYLLLQRIRPRRSERSQIFYGR